MRHVLTLGLVLLLTAVTLADDLPVAPGENGPSAYTNVAPRVVASGNDFVAIWSVPDQPRFARFRKDAILFTGDFGRPGSAAGAVAGPNGTVLVAFSDAEGIRVATIATNGEVTISTPVSQSFSSMAWNGAALLIVTREGDTLITSASGQILHHGAQLALNDDGVSSASARGTGFAVAWATVNDVFVTTLSNTGQATKEQKIADRQIGVAGIGCNPSGTCLLLSAQREPLSGQILGDTPGPLFTISQDLAGDATPPVWDGQRFLVTWTDYTFGDVSMRAEVEVAAVTLGGTVTPLATITSPDRIREMPAIAHANGETIVAWHEWNRCRPAGSQIVTRSLLTSRDLRLTSGPAAQADPAIAAGPANALIAWTELSGGSRIRARFYPFTEPAFDISSGPGASAPVVATDGSGGYLVAWRESRPVGDDCRSELLVSAAGSGQTFTLGPNADYEFNAVQVTWTGSEYAVLWEQSDPTQLLAIRVDRSGRPIDPIAVSLTQPEQSPDHYTSIDHQPAGLFWTGNGYLLVWRRSRQTYIPWYPNPPAPQYDIRTLRLGPHLFGLGTQQILGPGFYLAAAQKGNGIVAVWKPTGTTLHAIRLSAEGTVLEDRDLGIPGEPARVVATRSGYALQTWEEILFLDDALSVVGRRPLTQYNAALVETPAGLAEVYERGDTVYLSWPQPRRRALR